MPAPADDDASARKLSLKRLYNDRAIGSGFIHGNGVSRGRFEWYLVTLRRQGMNDVMPGETLLDRLYPMKSIRRQPFLFVGIFLLASAVAASAADAGRIVLIGGKKSHGPGQHDFPNGIPLFAAQIKAAAPFAGIEVQAFPTGWPADPAVFDHALTVLMYFDGVQTPPVPLEDAARIAQVQKLMDAGVGFICLHQASTVPPGNTTIPMAEWLGARRNGMFDRSEESFAFKPASPSHPILSGVSGFTFKDEVYPTLIFNSESSRLTPILTVSTTVGAAKEPAVAWAYERPGGGRSFGFTGGHYLAIFTQPQMEKILLNAVAWTAHLPVPAGGVDTSGPVVGKAVVTQAGKVLVLPQPWGTLTWYTSAAQNNSETATTGLAVIKPGQANPRHFHPNCDETLHVISGKILNTMNEASAEMNAGDTVTIPQGTVHNARNIGTEDAVLAISYSSANRETVGEQP